MKIRKDAAQHPEKWRDDLNPEAQAGQNIGLEGPHPENDAWTAYEIKEIHEWLNDFEDSDLKQIPVLMEGARLEQGATYIDVRDPNRQPFVARGDIVSGPRNWFVPKDRVDYLLWNRLTGVMNPERLGQAPEL